MKKSKSIIMVAIACLTVFVSTMTGYVLGTHADNEQKKHEIPKTEAAREAAVKSDDVREEKTEKTAITTKYILKEEDGRIMLLLRYSDGTEKVYKSYEVNLNFLPEADRELLKQGIEADSLSEILQMVEDYM